MKKRLLEIEARRKEIRGLLEQEDQSKVDLDALETELRSLDTEKAGIEKRQKIIDGLNNNKMEGRQLPNPLVPPLQKPEARSFSEMTTEELLATPEYRSAYLKNLQHRSLNEIEQNALHAEAEKRAITTGGASAGAAVPTTTYDMIIKKLRQISVLFPLIRVTYIPGNVILPVANARTAAVWSDEAVDLAEGDDTVSGVSLSGFTLAKYAKVSAAAMIMTIDAFETYIADQMSEQLAIAIENAILNGKGPTPGGSDKAQPTGILSAVGVTWDNTNSGTYASTGLAYNDFVDIRAKLGSMYRPGSTWVMNSNIEAELFKIKTSTGKPIFTADPSTGFMQKILNIPYVVDDYMPDDTVLLGRMDYYYMNFSQSPIIEASREAGFGSASTMYRGMLIADGKPALSEAFCKLTKATA